MLALSRGRLILFVSVLVAHQDAARKSYSTRWRLMRVSLAVWLLDASCDADASRSGKARSRKRRKTEVMRPQSATVSNPNGIG
jgi:hypothetical protein